MIGFAGHAQTNDSLNTIERQQEALRQEQLRLQAKQDSLQREQDRITAEKMKQQQVAQPVVAPVTEKPDCTSPTFCSIGSGRFFIGTKHFKDIFLVPGVCLP